MTRDSRSTREATFRMPSFHKRFWQAFCTWKSRLLFWGLMIFALVQHLTLLGHRASSGPTVQPTVEVKLDEFFHVQRGDSLQQQKLAPGESIPKDTRSLNLGSLTGSKEIREAAELPELRSLTLSTTRVSADDIRLLASVPNLESLWVTGLPLTPDVSELQNLETLGLSGMQFSDVPAGTNPLEQLRSLPRLETLSLSNSRIEAAWLDVLRDIPRLRMLRIGSIPVGDEAVPLLIDLEQLRELRISRSSITRAGWNRLVSARPDLSLKLEDIERLERGFTQAEQARARSYQSLVMAFGFPAFVLGMLISMQLKTQFASPRARMTPGFAGPHLAVAFLVTAMVLFPPALIVWLKLGLSPAGPLALGLFVAAMFAWQSWLMSNLLTLPLLTIWFSLVFGAHTEFIGGILGRWFLTPDTTGVALVVLGGTATSIVFLAIRVFSVHEESAEYGLAMPADGFRALTSRSASRDAEKLAGRIIARSRIAPWMLDRFFEGTMSRLPSRKALRRIVLYQVVHGYGLLIMLPVFCLGVAFVRDLIPQQGPDGGMSVFFPTFFLPHIVLACLGSIWLQHGKWHAVELLRPQSRGDFVRGLFLGISSDVSYAAVWMIMVQIIGFLQGFSAFDRSAGETASLAIAFTVGYMLVATPTLLLVLSSANFWIYLGALTGLTLVEAAVWGGFLALQLDRSPFGIPAMLGLSIVAAVWIHRKARTRWMELELA